MALFNAFWFISHHVFLSIIGILGMCFLIGFHELGHFLFCKLFSIRTPSFSIGFGPRLWSKKIGETEFAISAIPLGGYVEIAGAAEVGQGEQKEAYTQDEYSFATKPFYQKLLVMLGGIIFNLLFAYVAIIAVFMTGLPKSNFLYPLNATPVIATVASQSIGEQKGLKPGDTIITVDEKSFDNDITSLIRYIQARPSQPIQLTIERAGKPMAIDLVIDSKTVGNQTVGVLGVTFEMASLPGYPFFTAIKKGIQITHEFIYRTIMGFFSIFAKRDIGQMSGPLMIVSMTVKGAEQGFSILIFFLAIISINLAILNLIPLPILDGGQILFYGIEALIRRQIPIRIKEYIHIASWILILLLILYISTKDIARIASPFIGSIKKIIGWHS
jgi:regulator of sigma E protease